MKTLIVYFTISGNTKRTAQIIQSHTGADLFEIKVAKPYDYNVSRIRVLMEMATGCDVDLVSLPDHIDEYDTVFIGSPLWINTCAPAIISFMNKVDLSGKTVIPFVTHGGGGIGSVQRTVEKYCPNSKVLDGIALPGASATDAQVQKWLKNIGIR